MVLIVINDSLGHLIVSRIHAAASPIFLRGLCPSLGVLPSVYCVIASAEWGKLPSRCSARLWLYVGCHVANIEWKLSLVDY
jgi:hypothetical protein